MDIESKRQVAKGLRGVSYDARIDRFTAEIYISGERKWLGSYHTAQEASDAYEEAAKQRPPRERSQSAFAQVYTAFRERHGGSDTEPPKGATLTYDGQTFTFAGVGWRKVTGRKLAFATWTSDCRTCGAEYRTMTPMPVSVAKGVTRNCHEHVTQSNPFGKKAAKAKASQPAEAAKPVTVKEQIAAHLGVLGSVYDRLPLQRVAELVSDRIPMIDTESCLRLLLNWDGRGGDTPLPVTLLGDDVLFPDNPARGLL